MWWLWLVAVMLAMLVAAAFVALRLRRDTSATEVLQTLRRLSWRQRLQVARGIATDSRVPRLARLLPLLLGAYLVFPLDIIPDFIPVLGQLDDVLVASVVLWLLLHSVPRSVVEDHVRRAANVD